MKLQDTSQTSDIDDSCSIPTYFITSTPNLKAGKIKQIPLDIDFISFMHMHVWVNCM